MKVPLFFVLLLLVGCASVPDTSPVLVPKMYIPAVMKQRPTHLGYAGYPTANLPGMPFYAWSVGSDDLDPAAHRMVWCCDDENLIEDQADIIAAAQADANMGGSGRVWLYLNEPDVWSQCGGRRVYGAQNDPANSSPFVKNAPELAALRFIQLHTLVISYDPSARFFVGGQSQLNSPMAREWWSRFVNELWSTGELWRVSGVHVHAYPLWTTGRDCGEWCMPELFAILNEWYQFGIIDKGLEGRPVWITETGNVPYCNNYAYGDQRAYDDGLNYVMRPLMEWFDSENPGYDRLYWFLPFSPSLPEEAVWWCGFLDNDGITPLGMEWSK